MAAAVSASEHANRQQSTAASTARFEQADSDDALMAIAIAVRAVVALDMCFEIMP